MRPLLITSDAIAERLRDDIISGNLVPGAPLRQESLAADLGVSRMPVRDALNKLHAEGLVDLFPNRGAFVASMTLDECHEIFDLRVLLECEALAHAMSKHTAKSWRALQTIQSELEMENETRLWAGGDRAFHEALYAPCERKRTLQMIASLRNAVERFYLANLKHDDHRRGWKKEHRDLLKAAMAGDAAKAQKCLTTHLRETEAVVARAITRGDQR